MSYTPGTVFGARLFDALGPWQTDALGWYCDALGACFESVYLLVSDQGNDGDPGYVPGWGSLFDPGLCPVEDLPYLGQFVGVQIPAGAPEATARALVRAESGKNRGTVASIRSAVERSISTPWAPNTAYLAGVLVTYDTGIGPVFYKVTANFTSGTAFDTTNLAVTDPTLWYRLYERSTLLLAADAYQLTIQVRPEQLTPPSSTTAILAAINATKPGGILLNLIVSDSPFWSDATKAWSAVGGTVTWATVSSGDV